MSQISAVAVKALRDKTNAPMMVCKAALTEAGGDMEKAAEIIRKKNKDIIVKKGERETAEGRIAAYIDPATKVGAILEMRCESAPVAKNDMFVALADDLAKQIALKNPANVEELLAQPLVGDPSKKVADRIGDVIGLIQENMKPARFKRLSGLLGSYIHHDGSVGVLLLVDGDKSNDQLLRDVCMHITARSPAAARREDIPAATIEKEKEIAKEQIAADPKNKNKPANILDMIIEGKMKTWLADNVLVEQPFVKDDTKTVGEVLQSAGLKVNQFVRLRVGEIG